MLFADKHYKNNILSKALDSGCRFSVYSIPGITFLYMIIYILSKIFSEISIESINNLGSKTILPLVSCGIAFGISETKAIPAGILTGFITQSGISVTNFGGSSQGISGIYGCILGGIIAGQSCIWSERFITGFKGKSGSESNKSHTLAVISAILLSLFINEFSIFINSLSLLTLTGVGGANSVLVSVALGIFMTADCMGPMYLAGYLFSCAALAMGDTGMFASMTAAVAVPHLSISAFCLLYNNRFTKIGTASAFMSLLGGLAGMPVSVIPFYTEAPVKMSMACASGGCIASMLCTLFGCHAKSISKGLLSLVTQDKPLYFLLSILSGVLITVFIMSLVFCSKTEDEAEEEYKNTVIAKTS